MFYPICMAYMRFLVIVIMGCTLESISKAEPIRIEENPSVNSLGMKMLSIPPGSFLMGTPEAYKLTNQTGDSDCWDELPAHQVRITYPFLISETEVTLQQFRQFRPDFPAVKGSEPYVSGVSWADAAAFCEWLSQKEGRTYRLPTEAEWEYACRAGTKSLFWSGDQPPSPEVPNAWGLKNVHGGVLEWCQDWYGAYPEDGRELVDPTGPVTGMARVVRGGCIDGENTEKITDVEKQRFLRSANRASIAPAFGITGASGDLGSHHIGFRVIEAPLPKTQPWPAKTPFVLDCVKQSQIGINQGPDPSKPWYRKRWLLPIPPENVPRAATRAAGLPPGMKEHNHSPGLTICPNGDVLLVIYTASPEEYEPEVSLIAARLRYGADEWDMPEMAFNFVDANDHAPLLWTDGNDVHLFWGNHCPGAYPFNWLTTTDNGASWGQVRFPFFEGPLGPYSPQPVNTAFRGKDGTLYVASDGAGSISVLWLGRDNGKKWSDPDGVNSPHSQARDDLREGLVFADGRSAGRHTAYVQLKDGSILAMGGKNTHIAGHMPKAISRDEGKTWTVGTTPFSNLGSNQRPSLIRLQSGRLFFSTDMHSNAGVKAADLEEGGAVVALSDDEGETWHIKKMTGAQAHERRPSDLPKDSTLGYSVACQAPNGIIHLITTMNTPCLHFELNEAWILSETAGGEAAGPVQVKEPKKYEEEFASGNLKASWSYATASDGRILLNGPQVFYGQKGGKKWEVTYQAGRKVGPEDYYADTGKKIWSREHKPDGSHTWTQWHDNGQKKSESTWREGKCEGRARCWDYQGRLITEAQFAEGNLLTLNVLQPEAALGSKSIRKR